MSEANNAGSGTLAFFREVTKYFMDFLETDFHKATLPKRAGVDRYLKYLNSRLVCQIF